MYLRSFEYFRAVAIMLIVASHCYAITGWVIDSFAERVVANLISGGTSLFVFISGFLFHHVFYPKFNYMNFIKKKFRNIYLPYLFLSIFAIPLSLVIRGPFPEYYFGPGQGLFDRIFRPAVLYLWNGGVFAYWYIPFIMCIFLLSPLFIRFIHCSRRLQIGIVCLTLLVSVLMHRPVNNFSILQSVVFFLPVYMFGILCSLEKEWIFAHLSTRLWQLLAGVLLLAILQALAFEASGDLQKPPFAFNGISVNIVQKLLLSVFFMIFLRRFEEVDNRIVKALAASSFSIYFLHGWFIYAISLIQDSFRAAYGLHLLPVFTALAIWTSYVLALKIKTALPHRSRMLIGW